VIAPLLRNRGFQSCLHWLRAPAVGWLAMNIAFVGWHIPAAYELALRSEAVHSLEHICFLFTSLLFWWRVLEPWPSQPHRPRWFVLPYLLTADVVNTGVSAYLCFAGRVIYPSYEHGSELFGLSALADQVAAGTEMWVLGSTVFLIPLTILSFRMLSRANAVGKDALSSPTW
jgi:cytochrome c oxidase assembly factor CtaG